MNKFLLGLTLACLIPTGLCAEDGERDYRCSRLYAQLGSGSVFSIRTKVAAHDATEAVSLCEIEFDKAQLAGMIFGDVGKVITPDKLTFIKTPLFIPAHTDEQPALIARGP